MGPSNQFKNMAKKDSFFITDGSDLSDSLTICKVGESQFFPINGVIAETTSATLFPVPGIQTVNRTAECTIDISRCMALLGRLAQKGDMIRETTETQTTIWKIDTAIDDRHGGLKLDLRFEKVNSLSGPNMRKA